MLISSVMAISTDDVRGMSETITLTSVLDKLEHDTGGERLAMTEVLHVIGNRGYGPLLLIVALLAILPTGIIPGLPSVCGLSIALIASQLAIGKRSPWLPRRLRRLSIERDRFTQVAARVRPFTRRLDRFVRPRLTVLTEGVATRVIALTCIVLGLTMIPLELIPFGAAAPGGAIALMALGLSGRDGLWVLLGIVPAAAGAWLVYTLIP